MCPRTKKWRRTLSGEAEGRNEGRKGGRPRPRAVLHFAVRRSRHSAPAPVPVRRRREGSAAREKSVAVSHDALQMGAGSSLDNRMSETERAGFRAFTSLL